MICIAKDTVFCEGNQQIPERATALPARTISMVLNRYPPPMRKPLANFATFHSEFRYCHSEFRYFLANFASEFRYRYSGSEIRYSEIRYR